MVLVMDQLKDSHTPSDNRRLLLEGIAIFFCHDILTAFAKEQYVFLSPYFSWKTGIRLLTFIKAFDPLMVSVPLTWQAYYDTRLACFGWV